MLLTPGEGDIGHPAELVDGDLADGLGTEPLAGEQVLGDRGLAGQGGDIGGQGTPDPEVPFDGVQPTEGLTGQDVGVQLVEGGGVDRVARLQHPHRS